MKAPRRGQWRLAGRRVRYAMTLGPIQQSADGGATAKVLYALNHRDVAVFTDRLARPVPVKANLRRRGWRR